MRPVDHFFSKLASLEDSLRGPSAVLESRDRSRLEQDFSQLIGPALGKTAAADLCNRTIDRVALPLALQKLGDMAAFFLGEYDGETMHLDREDWQEIQETLEDASGEMDINILTSLMGELLSRGILG
ncbi:hypothetical protein LQZ19_13765 [Treponema primitia]|uniref:hypothetical protein n=1 Tax=Treponema primitia TaxID=88058 RepID=UPI00397EA628